MSFLFASVIFCTCKKWDCSLVRGCLHFVQALGFASSTPPTPTIFFCRKAVSNPRKNQLLTFANWICSVMSFLFASVIFCTCKKWDCSLVRGCLHFVQALGFASSTPPTLTIFLPEWAKKHEACQCVAKLPNLQSEHG